MGFDPKRVDYENCCNEKETFEPTQQMQSDHPFLKKKSCHQSNTLSLNDDDAASLNDDVITIDLLNCPFTPLARTLALVHAADFIGWNSGKAEA